MKPDPSQPHTLGPTLPLLFATALAAACGPDSTPSSAAGDLTTTIDTTGGVVRVTNTGTAPEWDLAPVITIGPRGFGVGEGGPEEFGMASSASLGPDDAVYISDGYNAEVRVFGLDGEHRRTFGRHGDGPGEFASIESVAWVGDRLLALDLIGGRLNVFSPEGQPLGQRPATAYWGGSGRGGLYPVGDDEVYAEALSRDTAGSSFVYVGQNMAGETADTLHPPAAPWEHGVRCEWDDGWSRGFDIIYSPRLLAHPGPGASMYSARTDVYSIAVTRGADTLRVIERQLPAEPVTDEEWGLATADFEAFRDELPRAVCTPRRPVRPVAKPFIDEFFVAPDGRIWVEVMRTAGNRWEVFDPEGRLLATLPVREWKARSVPAFGPDHMVTIRQDSLEIDYVDVWRIETGGAVN